MVSRVPAYGYNRGGGVFLRACYYGVEASLCNYGDTGIY